MLVRIGRQTKSSPHTPYGHLNGRITAQAELGATRTASTARGLCPATTTTTTTTRVTPPPQLSQPRPHLIHASHSSQISPAPSADTQTSLRPAITLSKKRTQLPKHLDCWIERHNGCWHCSCHRVRPHAPPPRSPYAPFPSDRRADEPICPEEPATSVPSPPSLCWSMATM